MDVRVDTYKVVSTTVPCYCYTYTRSLTRKNKSYTSAASQYCSTHDRHISPSPSTTSKLTISLLTYPIQPTHPPHYCPLISLLILISTYLACACQHISTSCAVAPFASVIAGQFYGHLHANAFRVMPDSVVSNTSVIVKSKTAWRVPLMMAPSITPYLSNNPSYRVAKYSTSTGEILDFSQTFMNISEANSTTPPVWKVEFASSKKTYGITSWSNSQARRLAVSMLKDDKTWNTFITQLMVSAPPSIRCEP